MTVVEPTICYNNELNFPGWVLCYILKLGLGYNDVKVSDTIMLLIRPGLANCAQCTGKAPLRLAVKSLNFAFLPSFYCVRLQALPGDIHRIASSPVLRRQPPPPK